MPERSAREIAVRTSGHCEGCSCAQCDIVTSAIEQRDAEHMAGYRELAAREIQLRAEIARFTALRGQFVDALCWDRPVNPSDELLLARLRNEPSEREDAYRAENARLREALEYAKKYTHHRENKYEVCLDWCPRCRVEAALSPEPAKEQG